jgi:CRISPR-associated protein Cmr1
MRKVIPPCPPIPERRSTGHETRFYEIKLVTPLFGGGVTAGEPDATFPIRGTSIRGQLQFWWRATRGAIYPTSEDLFNRHRLIWGTTDQASLVKIALTSVKSSSPQISAQFDWDSRARKGQGGWRLEWKPPFHGTALPYALFPFQGQPSAGADLPHKKPPANFIEDCRFTLRVRFPAEFSADVETAVWAWVNFGGIGARTRRGCGSLLGREVDANGVVIKELAPSSGTADDLKIWFQQGCAGGSNSLRDWPTLPTAVFCTRDAKTPIDAWNQVIELFQYFRQGRDLGRNPGQQSNRPGRSRWPEPETIRRVLINPVNPERGWKHGRLDHIPNDAFPRAEFGLPIVFHFQGNGDPPETVLYPAAQAHVVEPERMASPLILKPLALSNGKAVSMIVRLQTQPLNGIVLQQGETLHTLSPNIVIRGPQLATYRNSPLSLVRSGSALEAFLALAQNPENSENGFQEVIR